MQGRICLPDPRRRLRKICGIHPGTRKSQCLLGLSQSLHPTESWCLGQAWESPGAPQHIPQDGISAAGQSKAISTTLCLTPRAGPQAPRSPMALFWLVHLLRGPGMISRGYF